MGSVMLPALDLASIFIANAVVTGVAALVLRFIRRYHPDLAGIGHWALGQACYAVGFVLLYFSMLDPFQRSSLPGFFFAIGGTLLTSLGFYRFLRLPGRPEPYGLAFFLLVVGFCLVVSLALEEPGYIMAATVTAQGVISTFNFLLLRRHASGAMRPAALTLAVLHALWALLSLTRALFIIGTGFDTRVAISMMPVSMLGGTFLLTCHALGLVWMIVGRMQEHLVHQAATDPLTGALNRRALQARLEQERARVMREGGGFALATFDLDHFKLLNDTHGHVVGDATLVGVVNAAGTLLRPVDAVARLGGEEFCLLLPDVTGDGAVDMAERLRRSLEGLDISSTSGPVAVAASFGVAWYGTHGHDWPTLLKAADSALYCAKRNGRNRVEVANPLTDADLRSA
jgi:diguanylate cyclase (GGDEF)-like protein